MADRENEQHPSRPTELFGEVEFGTPDAVTEDTIPEAPDRPIRDASTPIVRESSRERIDRIGEEEEESPGLWEGVKLAYQSGTVGSLISDRVGPYAPNPDFEMSDEKILEVAGDGTKKEDLPEDSFQYLADSYSQAELEAKAERTRLQMDREGKLADMGWTGLGLQVGVELFDPVAWGIGAAATAITGPAGLAATAVGRVNRAQRVIRAGAAGAAGNVAVEAAIRENKPIYDDLNLLYAGALGFGIAGGLSALSRNPSTAREAETFNKASQELRGEVEAKAQEVAEESLNFRVKNGKPFDSEKSVKNSPRFRATEGAEAVQIREGEWGWRVKQPEGENLGDTGAARTRKADPLSPEDSDLPLWVEKARRNEQMAPHSAWGKTGGLTSSVVKMMNSKNPVIRATGHVLGENAIGTKDRGITAPTPATQKQMQLQRKVEGLWMRGYKTNFHEFRKEKGNGKWSLTTRGIHEREFNEMVSDYIEGVRTDVPASVKQQGELLREIFEDYRVNLNQPGAATGEYLRPPEGFGTIPEDRTWMPHEPSYEAFNKLTREFGNENLELMFTRAIKNASDDISDAAARKAGKTYVKTLRKMRAGLGKDAGRILGSGDAEEIKRLLKEATDMSDVDVEDTIDALTAQRSGKGTGPRHGKQRTPLDMNTTMTMKGIAGGSREVSIRELFNRDAHDLFLKYNRRMSGSLAMARTRVPGLFDGITNTNEFETLKRKAREAGEMEGLSKKQIDSDIDQLDYLYKSVMGIPQMGQNHPWAESIRRLRDFQFSRVMGQVGFSQFPEVGQASTGVGLKATIKSVPSFRTMWRNAQDGSVKDELMDELELATGEGADFLRTAHIDRFDEMSGSMDTSMGSRAGAMYDSTIRKSNRIVGVGSGMTPLNTFSMRFAMAGIANRFDMMARGAAKGWSPQRMRSMGLADSQTEEILKEIRTHAEHKRGLTGKKLKKMNLDNWNPETKALFEDSLYRYSRRLVQQNDPGQFRPWMSNPIAQMLIQFRTFIIGAHTKALLHNIHMRDFQTFSTFTVSSAFGALGYISREYARSIWDDEGEQQRQERLSIGNVAKAAFERSSWAALMPMGIDTALTTGRFEPLFDFRSTAAPTDIIGGSAAVDSIKAGSSLLGAIVQPALDGRLPSKEELEPGLRVLPWHNLNGVTQMTNLVMGESGLPENAPRD